MACICAAQAHAGRRVEAHRGGVVVAHLVEGHRCFGTLQAGLVRPAGASLRGANSSGEGGAGAGAVPVAAGAHLHFRLEGSLALALALGVEGVERVDVRDLLQGDTFSISSGFR
eukprot:SAG31_NODE_16740_length_698_cov_0.766277_2_plen_113_part_01